MESTTWKQATIHGTAAKLFETEEAADDVTAEADIETGAEKAIGRETGQCRQIWPSRRQRYFLNTLPAGPEPVQRMVLHAPANQHRASSKSTIVLRRDEGRGLGRHTDQDKQHANGRANASPMGATEGKRPCAFEGFGQRQTNRQED